MNDAREAAIEAGARAFHAEDSERSWDDETEGSRNWYRKAAETVLGAAVPLSEGWEQCGWLLDGALWHVDRSAFFAPGALDDAEPVYRRVDGAVPQPDRTIAAERAADANAARVGALTDALDQIAHSPIASSSDAVRLRQIARHALDGAVPPNPERTAADDLSPWRGRSLALGRCRVARGHGRLGRGGERCRLRSVLGEQEGAEDDPMPEAPDLDVVTGDGSGIALPPYDPENPGPHVADARKSRITVANEPRDDS